MKILSFRRRIASSGLPLMVEMLPTLNDGTISRITRGREVVDDLRVLLPNTVHAVVIRANGEYEDLGLSHNLRTNAGLDWEANLLGGVLGLGDQTATASSATSITKSGATWTTDQYKGFRVVADNGTAAPVYGNIGTNSATVLTVDQWWNEDDTLGTTPSSTGHFAILPSIGPARFIGITADTAAAAATDTTLASEQTANGLARALGTFAHTGGVSSYTLSKTFTYTGSGSVTIHKAGTFTASTTTAGGIMVFETVLNADATVTTNGDQIALTWTVNI